MDVNAFIAKVEKMMDLQAQYFCSGKDRNLLVQCKKIEGEIRRMLREYRSSHSPYREGLL